MRSKPDIRAEVAALGDFSREQLIERWSTIYGSAPPKGIRHDLMVRAIAWHLQAKRLGGFSAETRRLLRSAISRVENEMVARSGSQDMASDTRNNSRVPAEQADCVDANTAVTSSPRQRRRVAPGARLMREWNGRTHVVDVIESGFVFEAKVYSSLTAIAGKITGAHWSGPRFFGL